MTAERGHAERGGDLADGEVGEEDPSRGRDADRADELLGALPEPGALEDSDDGKDEPSDRHVAVRRERLADRGDDPDDVHPARDTGDEASRQDHEQRIQSEGEADHDDQHAEQGEHGVPP